MAGLEFMRFRVHLPHRSFSSQVWLRHLHPRALSSIPTFLRCGILSWNPHIMSSSWPCTRCTYINISGLVCALCDYSKEDLPIEEVPRKRKADEVGSDEDGSSRKRLADEESKREPRPKINSLLQQLHMEKLAREKAKAIVTAPVDTPPAAAATEEMITVLTYNVWFEEGIQLEKRMAAIGDLVKLHRPHVLCFQEVTANIFLLLQGSSWWREYTVDTMSRKPYFCLQLSRLPVDKFYRNPFRNTIMGRELCMADLDAGDNVQLVVATTHLESPCPGPPKWDQMYSPERVAQAKECFATLNRLKNVIFCGDFNWDDKLDGKPPHGDGWVDAWLKLRPDEPGLTYDAKMNPMLGSGRLQKRLDRMFCRLEDFEVESIEMIGTKALPGVTYQKEKTVQKQKQLVTLPVLPSDHYGLVLKVRRLPASPC